MEPFLIGIDAQVSKLIMDINAAVAEEAAEEAAAVAEETAKTAAKSKVTAQVKAIEKKITDIGPILTKLTDKKKFQSRLGELSSVINKDKPLIEKSSLPHLIDYEKFFTGIDTQVNRLIMDIIEAEDEEASKVKKLTGIIQTPPTAKPLSTKPEPGLLGLDDDDDDDDGDGDDDDDDDDGDGDSGKSLSPSSKTDWDALFKSTDDSKIVMGGGKKQRKRFTKKKQNNNKNNIKKKQNNIKKKRVSIKKNKRRIITRNTRRRIFE
jgi:hypothetical protein